MAEMTLWRLIDDDKVVGIGEINDEWMALKGDVSHEMK